MSSFRRDILRSSSIVGFASLASILFGLLRMKVSALLLGPAGVGLAGLLQNAMTTAGGLASLGIGTVGARQVAEAVGRGDEAESALARKALRWGSVGLAALGGGLFWLAREPLARLLGDVGLSRSLGWLAIGVALTVLSGAQLASLTGLRRVGDVARVQIGGGLFATLIAVAAIWFGGAGALAVFVVAVPLGGFVAGLIMLARLPPEPGPRAAWPKLRTKWVDMARLGLAFTGAGLAGGLGQLAVRALIARELGANELGQFQAAWIISMTYLGFVLQAMGTDYFPRLSAAAGDHAVARDMINDQAEVALLLAGPALLVVSAFAPWGISLLYSTEFAPAVELLRWQVLGDVFKIMSYPLGFLLLARGEGRSYFWTEAGLTLIFIIVTALLLPILGVLGASSGFIAMYVLSIPVLTWIARKRIGFGWRPIVGTLAGALFTACGAILAVARWWSETAAMGAGAILALGYAGYAFQRLRADPARAPIVN